MRRPIEDRFWEKVDRSAGDAACWPWNAYIAPEGYGRFTIEAGVVVLAHRLAWELTRGSIQPSKQLDHVCRNRACVNPLHLEPVTSQVNTLRGLNEAARKARSDVCKRGHDLIGDNVYRHPKRGTRHCRQCARDRRAGRV